MAGFLWLCGIIVLYIYILIIKYPFRSEQDKEPEKEVVCEVVGPVPSEESTDHGMWLTFGTGIRSQTMF